MKRLLRPALMTFVAAMAVAALVLLVLTRNTSDTRRHAEILATLDALTQTETNLDRDLLRVMAGLLPHYDTLVEHSNDLNMLFQRLNGEQAADDKTPAQALTVYRQRINAKLEAADQIKATAAFVRREEAYLPFATADYARTAPAAQALKVHAALIALHQLGEKSDPELEAELGATLAKFAGGDAALRNISQHMRVLLEQRLELRRVTDVYFSVESQAALELARGQYMNGFAERQSWLETVTRGLQLLSLLLFVALGYAISRLGRAQHQAETAHAQLIDAVNSLQEAFALFDRHHRLVLSNSHYDALFPGRGRIESYRALLRELGLTDADGADPAVVRESLISGTGNGRVQLFRTHPTSDRGSVCLFTDLTEQQRMLALVRKLTAAVEQSPIAIIITDEAARIEYVNPRFQELTGYGTEDVLGHNPRILKSGDVAPEIYEEMWKTLSQGLTWRGQLVNRKKSGELFWENTVISPIRDPQGRIVNYVALKEDITQQMHNADLLLDANADNERMLFAASHDLQEPVRLMHTYCQLLERQLPADSPPTARESIGFIMEGARQLSLLIRGMAAYSRSSRPTTAFVPVDCANVVQGAIADCRAMAAFESPLFRVGPLPTIIGDPVLMMMMFQNLIGNALKFRRPDRPAEISIRAERDGEGWRIDIADNGIGIEKQYLATITAPFSRLHPRSTHPGAGLGLSSCVKIAKLHGGRLWLDSQPDQGTIVHVWLPGPPN